jgi:hypothetical protein
MVEGPAIQPADILLGWLRQRASIDKGGRRLFRLPVVVRFADAYRLALGEACVSTSPKDTCDNHLQLQLDDTALGISLLDRVSQHCPKPALSCAIWLEGYFGELLEDVLPKPKPAVASRPTTKWPFAVMKVEDTTSVEEQPAQPPRAWSEP